MMKQRQESGLKMWRLDSTNVRIVAQSLSQAKKVLDHYGINPASWHKITRDELGGADQYLDQGQAVWLELEKDRPLSRLEPIDLCEASDILMKQAGNYEVTDILPILRCCLNGDTYIGTTSNGVPYKILLEARTMHGLQHALQVTMLFCYSQISQTLVVCDELVEFFEIDFDSGDPYYAPVEIAMPSSEYIDADLA